MPRIQITNRHSNAEEPYWRIQAIPDCIRYTIQQFGAEASIKHIFGPNGFNDKIFQNLEVLHRAHKIKLTADDPLYTAYRRYLKEESFMGPGFPFNVVDNVVLWDPAWGIPHRPIAGMLDDLLAFQRAACVGKSYMKYTTVLGRPQEYCLPFEAKFAAFWDEPNEVELPRLTKAQYEEMKGGWKWLPDLGVSL